MNAVCRAPGGARAVLVAGAATYADGFTDPHRHRVDQHRRPESGRSAGNLPRRVTKCRQTFPNAKPATVTVTGTAALLVRAVHPVPRRPVTTRP